MRIILIESYSISADPIDEGGAAPPPPPPLAVPAAARSPPPTCAWSPGPPGGGGRGGRVGRGGRGGRWRRKKSKIIKDSIVRYAVDLYYINIVLLLYSYLLTDQKLQGYY